MKIILCRAFLSAWYERGGMYPADENDKPVFVGRANLGKLTHAQMYGNIQITSSIIA